MQICMITSAPMPPTEGIGYYVWNLSHFLVGEGHQVQIITRGQRGKPFREKLDTIPIWRPRFYPVYPVHVHLHGMFVQWLLLQLEADVDLFHLHTPLPPAIRSSRPCVVTVHTPMMGEAKAIPIRDVRSLVIRLQIPFSVCIERQLLTNAGAVTAVSQSVAEELQGYGLHKSQVTVLKNGANTDVFHPVGQGQSARADRMYILAAGRLDVRKGLADLVEAMGYITDDFPTAQLYIAGAGPIERQLRIQVAQLKLDGVVQFLGHVEQAEMVELYQGATVFAHAAHYEGLPTVLLEAMSCRKPVVSTAVSGALDVVRDGFNGLLVPPRAPRQLAIAICRLLSDAELRANLGTSARHTIEEHFSWQVVGSNYLRCYQELLEEANQ